MASSSRKDKNVATILAFFMGSLGIHRFYLGQIGLGVFYLLTVLTGLSCILGFIDFIAFLVMKTENFNAKYNPTVKAEAFEEELETETVNPHSDNKKKKLLRKLNNLRKNIRETLKKSDHYTKEVARDIAPLMNKYMEQVQDLLERDEKLERILSQNSVKEISMKISELQSKLDLESSTKLKREYNKAINRHKKRKNIMQDFQEQRKIINLRLQEVEMSFEKIEYDLVRIETLNEEEQRQEFNKIFKERSGDLENYLHALKSTYDSMK